MAMTNVMDDVDYDTKNFNLDISLLRQSLKVPEGHQQYHLYRDEKGSLFYRKTNDGEYIRSPRSIMEISMNKIVCDQNLVPKLRNKDLPYDLYPGLLAEAVYQRELHGIENLVATWPSPVLVIYDVLPEEEYIDPCYLTLPIEGQFNNCLLDGFMLGLLNQKPESRLKFVDFTGFDKDRKLCKELCRLPLLWMKPEDRQLEDIHSYLKGMIEISKDKVQRYINRITVIYSDIDTDLRHGNKIEPMTIMLNCKMNMDDVPIGLALQHLSPYKFVCNKMWMATIPEVFLPPQNINKILDPLIITHFEIEDNQISSSKSKQLALIRGLHTMPNILALSLSNTLDVTISPDFVRKLNRVLRVFRNLRKLNLSFCNLKGTISTLLQGLRQPMVYLNLRDCRLIEEDMQFLMNWSSLKSIREFNLSRNSLGDLSNYCLAMLSRVEIITCFSVSYCSLPITTLKWMVTECKKIPSLKILCMQTFTPASWDDIHDILFECAHIDSLQKICVLPEAYAFPGNNQEERIQNKRRLSARCTRYLKSKGRHDIEIE